MANQNEFHEPWWIEEYPRADGLGEEVCISDVDTSFICDGFLDGAGDLAMKRIVDCVNVCAGLSIEEVREAIALMDSMQEGSHD